MEFSSKTTIQSKVDPSVSYVVRVLNEPRRLKGRLALADANRRLREIRQEAAEALEVEELTPEVVATFGPQQFRIFGPFQERTTAIFQGEIVPDWMRRLLVEVKGLSIDGKPATLEAFFEDGPEELQWEIGRYITDQVGLTKREEGESVPPTISQDPEDGRISNTGAPTVESGATT